MFYFSSTFNSYKSIPTITFINFSSIKLLPVAAIRVNNNTIINHYIIKIVDWWQHYFIKKISGLLNLRSKPFRDTHRKKNISNFIILQKSSSVAISLTELFNENVYYKDTLLVVFKNPVGGGRLYVSQ